MSEQWFIKEMETKPKCKELVNDLRHNLEVLCKKDLKDILLLRDETVTFVYINGRIVISRKNGLAISNFIPKEDTINFTVEFIKNKQRRT